MSAVAAAVMVGILLTWTSPARAQSETADAQTTPAAEDPDSGGPETLPPPVRPIGKLLPDIAGDLVHLPSTRSAVWLGALGGLSFAGMLLDDELSRDPGREWPPASEVFDPGSWMGNGLALGAGAAITYGVGRWTDRPRVAQIGRDLLRAQAVAHIVTQGIKHGVRRDRPDLSGSTSFPSGHAAAAFASAAVMQRHLSRRWAITTHGIATYVAMSRMHENRHYLSDVIFGSAIGLISGFTVTRDERPRGWEIVPTAGRSSVSVMMVRAVE